MKKTIKIIALCLLTSLGYAQQKQTKVSQSIKVNKDVIVDLNTSHVEIQLETWNRDIVEVEAYVESSKLSKEELKKALESWNLKVDGANNQVTISSDGSHRLSFFGNNDYAGLLEDMEMQLADLPEIPQMPAMPNMPHMGKMPEVPEMPEMPEMPELPELPKGVNSVSFDYERYQKEGEKYMKEWSKEYEKKGGKELQKSMEKWAKKFTESGYQEKMEKWGEEYGKRFEGQWAKDMEKWGEQFGKSFGKDMEKWGEEFGKSFGKEWEQKMEAWGERFGKQMEERAKIMEERGEAMGKHEEKMAEKREKLAEKMEERRASMQTRHYESGGNSQVKKVIKIKIPKKAILKTNIRHGELKISSVISNMKGDIAYSYFVAEHIDGSDTSINVSYSPVMIDTWDMGTLNLNFVERAQIQEAKDLVLNSKSSNINITNLKNTGLIDGSFGDLTISNLADTFKNLNLILEHSDALVYLPKDVDYSLNFKGDRSKFNNKATTQKSVNTTADGTASNKVISINAKFSSVIMN
ncbi:YggN family protein [Winogradskyella ursingii]|uniref:hypothetical protein n=1 Tax=Winogradskyella ursingii TaxID=2686079 RepID=UPI0015C69A4E|nr:hypothetical protein [Winogradskyella ursingii]